MKPHSRQNHNTHTHTHTNVPMLFRFCASSAPRQAKPSWRKFEKEQRQLAAAKKMERRQAARLRLQQVGQVRRTTNSPTESGHGDRTAIVSTEAVDPTLTTSPSTAATPKPTRTTTTTRTSSASDHASSPIVPLTSFNEHVSSVPIDSAIQKSQDFAEQGEGMAPRVPAMSERNQRLLDALDVDGHDIDAFVEEVVAASKSKITKSQVRKWISSEVTLLRLGADAVAQRLVGLQTLVGSAEAVRMCSLRPQLLTYTTDKMVDTWNHLVNDVFRGNKDIVMRMVKRSPVLLCRSGRTIAKNLEALSELMTPMPVQPMLIHCPELLMQDIHVTKERMDALAEGVGQVSELEVRQMVTRAPRLLLLRLDPSDIEERLLWLADVLPAGADVLRTLARQPQLLQLRVERMQRNVDALEDIFVEHGGCVPKMVEIHPTLLYGDIERTIKPKIKLLGGLMEQVDRNLIEHDGDILALIARSPPLVFYSERRIRERLSKFANGEVCVRRTKSNEILPHSLNRLLSVKDADFRKLIGLSKQKKKKNLS